MTDFYEELAEGDIHIRDKFQFELKSEYSPLASLGTNTYTLEFFIFVPSALQINKDTYTKQQFYYDQTNFIRLKTPGVSLADLGVPTHPSSPLQRIRLRYQSGSAIDEKSVIEDLKLYANMARSAIRNRVRILMDDLRHVSDEKAFAATAAEIEPFCQELRQLRHAYVGWQEEMHVYWQQGRMSEYGQYIDEFVSSMVERYAAGLLQELMHRGEGKWPAAQSALAALISSESSYRAQHKERPPFAEDPERRMEYAVYRGGLLKKFVSEALFLNLKRKEPMKTFQQVAAAVAAGLAMLVYLYFLSFHSVNPVLDSTAFIILSVLLYVLKDRLKDGLKSISSRLARGWFPDYRTQIRTPNGELILGYLKEYFFALSPRKIPKEIEEMRNTQFHTELERARRLETLFYFRKEVLLLPQLVEPGHPLFEIIDIFRFNLSRFVIKASDPYKEQLLFDPESQQVKIVKGPKVYHINIIMRKRFLDQERNPQISYKKYRVVLDKEGIKRIEKVG